MSSTTTAHLAGRRTSPPAWLDLVAVGAAIVCAVVVWATARLSGVDLTVRVGEGLQHVTGVAVVIVAAVAAGLGLIALRVMTRFFRKPLKWWTILVIAVAVVSALGPLGATSAAAAGTLIGLHAVVAAVVLAAGWRSRRGGSPYGG